MVIRPSGRSSASWPARTTVMPSGISTSIEPLTTPTWAVPSGRVLTRKRASPKERTEAQANVFAREFNASQPQNGGSQ
jgi:hypothetical protein